MKTQINSKPRRKREAVLKARWDQRLIEQLASAAQAEGQTVPEVLRRLALGYIEKHEQGQRIAA